MGVSLLFLVLLEPRIVMGFAPWTYRSHTTRLVGPRAALDPHIIQDWLQNHHLHHHHATTATTSLETSWQSLLSTMYTSGAEIKEVTQKGQASSWYGAWDPKSIAPMPGGSPGPSNIVDGVQMIKPAEMQTNVPDFMKETPPSESEEVFKLQLIHDVKTMYVSNRLPNALFLATMVDFFVVSAGLDIYKEEIAEDPDQVNKAVLTENLIRVGVVALVTTLTMVVYS